MQPANPNESVAHWTTEYDSTSAKIFAEHTEGKFTGVIEVITLYWWCIRQAALVFF